MEIILSILLGIGLSAASGFRIFVPFLVLGIAGSLEIVGLNDNFDWIASTPSIITFAAATSAELFCYFNPWIDNMLDTITTPLSIIAGITLSLSVMTGLDPLLNGVLAVILGGGIAANFQFLSVKARSVSSIFSGGFGNPIIAGSELFLSLLVSILSVLIPVITFLLVLILMIFLYTILKNAKAKLNESFN